MGDDFDLQAFLPYLLNQAAEAASAAFARDYKARHGLLRTEWRVIAHLGQYGPMTARDICTRAHLHKTKVSRAVAALHARRLVARDRNDADRRVEVLTLTQAGRVVFADLGTRALAAEAALCAPVDPADLAATRRVLARLAGMAGT